MNFVPFKTEPFDVGFNRLDVFGFLLGRVRVVEKQIAKSVILLSRAEVEAKRFCVTYMQVTVRLGRESRMHRRDFAAFEFAVDDFFDKVFRFHFLSPSASEIRVPKSLFRIF